ncbi:MAG TPA: ABC transporter ATP-binding protein [Nitriliruptorales bacterium]|nr:ABC transporter ATP-binding protein [Nitriliruptorales bacterium]
MSSAVIVTEGLTKRYGSTLAVDHLDLQVERGEVFGLLGPNGAGKTTTVLMLLGLSEPSEGRATVLGLDPTRQALEVKRRVGYLPDSVGFYERLSGRQNLAFVARLNGVPGDEAERRIGELLELVGLSEPADEPTGTYSRGMLQRLGIADALVKDPEILVLDEPTIAIDPQGVGEILQLIRDLRDGRGVTVLLSSHLLYQVQEVCDRVAIFVAGRLVSHGTVEELSRRLVGNRQTFEVGVRGDPEVAAREIRATPGVETVVRERGLLVVAAEDDVRPQILARLQAAELQAVHLRQRGSELDEIYRRYFERSHGDVG